MSSYHLLADTVLAAPAPEAPEGLVRNAQIPGWVAIIVGALILIQVWRLIGRLLPYFVKFDNVVRVAIAFFGFVGPLSLVPIFSIIPNLIDGFLSAFLKGAGWSVAVVAGLSIVSIGLAGLGAYSVYKKAGLRQIIIMTVFCLPLFGMPWMRNSTIWYVDHIGVPTWNGFVSALNWMSSWSLVLQQAG